jgi:PatG C-terminal
MQEETASKQPSRDTISSSEHSSPSSNSKEVDINISTQSTMDKPCTCGKEDCPSCNSEHGSKMFPRSYVYAIGKVVHRFPNKSLEIELAQATGRGPQEETRGQTREEALHKVITDPANRYIARQICYVLTIEGLETYILVPTDPLDVDRLAQALRPAPRADDIDVIIGLRGPIAPAEMCNGLMIPIVRVDQIYSFDRDALMKAIPKRKGVSEDQYRKTSDAVFNHIIKIADNAGATDEHRALNYLAVRYDEIYHRTQLMQDENYSFTAVEVRMSPLSGTRKIVDVIFSYENRANRATQKWFARVDVTEEFPFLVSPLQQYIEY